MQSPAGAIPYFLQLLSQWKTAIPINSQWVLFIDFKNLLNVLNILNQMEPSGWNINKVAESLLQEDTQRKFGCIFAQGVSIPGETIQTESTNIAGPTQNNNGFIRPWVINGRQEFSHLDVTFLDTNASFGDFIIRPWSILTSHLGLLAYDPNDIIRQIKADIYMFKFAKAGWNTEGPVISKQFYFKDCAAIGISDEEYNYQVDSSPILRQASFVYQYYTMSYDNSKVDSLLQNSVNNSISP